MIQNSIPPPVTSFVLKEVILRGAVQETFKWSFSPFLPKKEVEILFCHIELVHLTSLVATSILFGAANSLAGTSLPYVIFATLGSITWGVLASHYGCTPANFSRMIQEVTKVKKREGLSL